MPTAQEQAATIIAAIDAALALSPEATSYTVNGRVVQMRSTGELLELRQYYENLLRSTAGRQRRVVEFG